jgi:hypothetical protein
MFGATPAKYRASGKTLAQFSAAQHHLAPPSAKTQEVKGDSGPKKADSGNSGVCPYASPPNLEEPPMSQQPLIVSIPHRLGREEAKRRVDSGISRLRPELAGLISTLDYSWEEDRLNFNVSAMWQTITGAIEVLDDAVRIEVHLPWMMSLLADTIAKQVRGRGIAMLEKPPGDA